MKKDEKRAVGIIFIIALILILVLDKLNIVENKEIDLNQYVENQNKLVFNLKNDHLLT